MFTTEHSPQRIRRIALGDMLQRSACRFGEHTALIDGEQRISYGELNKEANRLAHHLLGQGLRSKDGVGMLCANSIQMVIAVFGIQKAGLTWVPINTSLAADAIGYIIDHAEIRSMIIDAGFYGKTDLPDLLQNKNIEPLLTVLPHESSPEGTLTLLDAIASGPPATPEIQIRSEQLAFIMYTSGPPASKKASCTRIHR